MEGALREAVDLAAVAREAEAAEKEVVEHREERAAGDTVGNAAMVGPVVVERADQQEGERQATAGTGGI